MKKLTKQDIYKLRYLAEKGVESEAYCLSCEMNGLHDRLGNNYENLPEWRYLVMVAGEMNKLAEMMKFMKDLDKKPRKK